MKKHRTNRIHEKHLLAEAAVDLTAVFRRAGLPHKVLASARFAAGENPEHHTLTWMVRCTLTECLPARRFRTSRGELFLIEYPGFPDGDGQDKPVVIAALRPAAGLIELLLPEELEDLT